MIGLILETSTEKGAIVLARDTIPLDSKPLLGGPLLSKTLALEVDLLLKKHSLKPTYIAVGTGPGSYTGVRVGAALAKALSFGWQIPLFGFCSLAAFSPPKALPHAVLVDARMGGIYVFKEGAASLLSLSKAEESLQTTTLFISPHPEVIQKRVPLKGKWIKTAPDPQTLSFMGHRLFLEEQVQPLSLVYDPIRPEAN